MPLAIAITTQDNRVHLLVDGKVKDIWENTEFVGMFFSPNLTNAINVFEDFETAVEEGNVEPAGKMFTDIR